ncbi:Flp pilus assembly complex ATPase component TadA [Candidatus Woesearchaeota archaeon]|nr:Flp pilus assembly complex ATPase component TadA [Candidatus Woesearchaeota archaeon]
MFEKLLKKEASPEKEAKKEEFLFKVELQHEIPALPDFKTKEETDIRYPLIEPYAYVHIRWDSATEEVIYEVEEPLLDKREKEILRILEDGIKELINISFVSAKEGDNVIKYLEKNIKILLNELGFSLSKETFLKIMYYVYRDFVGLNEIEPMMNDYFIEDIECNGVNSPVYIIHRKYRNLKTNISFDSVPYLAGYVEKLAQKCGRYVSYASPLLDGSLPNGSRVNATYTADVSSKGPTFTIRQFSKEPWSPPKMIELGTVSPEMLAYLWILVENEFNVMVIGGTGSGKTTCLNTLAFFIPQQARVVSIEDSVTGDSKLIIKKDNQIKNITIKEFVDKKIDAEILTLDEKGKLIFVKPSKHIKHKVKKEIYEILTSTGRKVKVTQDHSLFTLGDSGLKEIKPAELKENKSFIAVPRSLPVKGVEIKELNLMNYLNYFKEDFLQGDYIKKIFEIYSFKDLNVKKERYIWWKRNNIIKVKEFMKLKINFSYDELKTLRIKSKNTSSIPVLFSISNEFFSVIISNVDKECRNIFRNIAKILNLHFSHMNDNGVSLRIHSTILYKFMKYVIKLDGYSDNKKIPEFIFGLSNEQINHFIKGYFSADGCVKKYEVSCASQSYKLLEDLQSMLLRFGIISRINDFNRKDKCINLSISSSENISKFKQIGFLQEIKNYKLSLLNKVATHACSDIIPLSFAKLSELKTMIKNRMPSQYLTLKSNIGRGYLQRIAPIESEFNDISHNDVLWDKVKKITKRKSDEVEVFDLSVPKYEKFLCNNIIVHNTRELMLEHENWLPSVAREGIGLANIVGQKYGEVTLFDLLKESFRQRPDYVIVGEVRGKEAFVLFQGMASGHPSMGTMHANDVQTMIRRLETPPIELSPSLVESMDAVCIMSQAKYKDKEVRRLKQIAEIISVPEEVGKAQINTPFQWDSRTDTFYFKTDSYIFQKLMSQHGYTKEHLVQEFDYRTKLLYELYKRKIFYFREVQKIIHEYARSPKKVLKDYGIIK